MRNAVLIAATAVVIAGTAGSTEAAWYKSITRPLAPVIRVVQGGSDAVVDATQAAAKPVIEAIVQPAIKEVAAPVVREIAKPLLDHVVKPALGGAQKAAVGIGGDFKDAAIASYHAALKTPGTLADGFRGADKYTLAPVKHYSMKYAIGPTWKATGCVRKPLIRATQKTTDFIGDDVLGMEGSFLPFGEYYGDFVGWCAKKTGVMNGEVLKSIADPTRMARASVDQLVEDAPVFVRHAQGQVWDSISLDPTRTIGAALNISNGAIGVVDNATVAPLRPVITAYAHGLMYQDSSTLPVKADPSMVDNEDIYYVNGVDYSLDGAADDAKGLSSKAGRAVHLIYNNDNGKPLGFAEGAYNRVYSAVQVGPLRMLNGDSTSRRITGLIRERAATGKDTTIVCFSQGCLETTAALRAAATLGYGDYIRNHVRIIYTGVPMIDAELQPKPKSVHYLGNREDPVFHLGLNSTNPAVDGHGHNFLKQYLQHIDPEWLR